MNCNRCGGVIIPPASFCEDCGAPVEARPAAPGGQRPMDPVVSVAVPGPATAVAGPDAAAVPGTLPGTPIRLSDGEDIWRVYRAVRLRSRRRGQGTLFVTDSRVVFYAWAKGTNSRLGSELVQQVKLKDVTGFSAYVTRRVSLFLMVLTAVFSIAAVVTLFTLLIPLTILFLIFTGVCIAAMFTDVAQVGSAGIEILSRDASVSAVEFGGLRQRNSLVAAFVSVALFLVFPPLIILRLIFRSYTAFDVKRGRPGDDSNAVIAELGALIMDLQTRGTFAGEHWGIQPGGDQLQVRGAG